MKLPILKELGLTDSEIKVYLALLNQGDATRGDIVTKSQIAGSKVYEILEKLQNKGLVAIYNRNNVKHFKPTHPKQILAYVEEKKRHLADVESQVKAALPLLLDSYNSSKAEQEVELLLGLKGLDIMFREQIDILNKGDVCYVIGGTKGTDEPEVIAFFQKIHAMREAKGIKTKMLYNIRQKEMVSQSYGGYKGTAVRFIQHISPVAINIYNDRTVIIIFGKHISAVHIKSEEVSKSFMEYFNLLWISSK